MRIFVPFVYITHVVLQAQAGLHLHRISSHAADAPTNRMKPFIAFHNQRLFLFGGLARSGQSVSDTWMFDLESRQWTNLNILPAPPVRYYGIAGIVGGKFVISTGEDRNTGRFFNDAWELEQAAPNGSWSWKEVVAQNDDPGQDQARPRYGSAGAVYNDQLCVAQGFAGARFSDIFCINPHGTSRQVYSGNSQYDLHNAHARCLGSHAYSGAKMVLYGGCMRSGFAGGPCPAKDTWEWDFAANAWTRGEDHPVPTVHGGMASFTEEYMIQYGGEEKSRQRIAGASLSPDLAFLYASSSREWKAIQLDVTDGPRERLTFHDLVRVNETCVLVIGADENDASLSVWMISGNPADATAWTNHLQPYFSLLALHGIFMVIGWGFFIQVGSYVFRYWRHKPWSFKVHRIMNSLGLLFAIIGLILVFISGGSPLFTHGIIGLLVMIAGISQPISAYYRCHKPDDEHPNPLNRCMCGWDRRWIFNFGHHMSGRFALVGAVVNISLGFPLLVVERIELWFGLWFCWVGLLVVAYIVSEILVYTGKLPAIIRSKEERYLPVRGEREEGCSNRK